MVAFHLDLSNALPGAYFNRNHVAGVFIHSTNIRTSSFYHKIDKMAIGIRCLGTEGKCHLAWCSLTDYLPVIT